MLRKMGKPDTLRVLYRKVFVRKVWRLVQLELLGIGFRTYVRLVAAKGVGIKRS